MKKNINITEKLLVSFDKKWNNSFFDLKISTFVLKAKLLKNFSIFFFSISNIKNNNLLNFNFTNNLTNFFFNFFLIFTTIFFFFLIFLFV